MVADTRLGSGRWGNPRVPDVRDRQMGYWSVLHPGPHGPDADAALDADGPDGHDARRFPAGGARAVLLPDSSATPGASDNHGREVDARLAALVFPGSAGQLQRRVVRLQLLPAEPRVVDNQRPRLDAGHQAGRDVPRARTVDRPFVPLCAVSWRSRGRLVDGADPRTPT